MVISDILLVLLARCCAVAICWRIMLSYDMIGDDVPMLGVLGWRLCIFSGVSGSCVLDGLFFGYLFVMVGDHG